MRWRSCWSTTAARTTRPASAALADEFAQVRFVSLSKNYGEHNAVMAGLNHAAGDCVVVMDDDFQNPPEEVGRLVEEVRRGYDVVFTHYERKRHSRLGTSGSRFNISWPACF